MLKPVNLVHVHCKKAIISRVLLILTTSGSIPMIDVYVHRLIVQIGENDLPVSSRQLVNPVERVFPPVSPVNPVLVDHQAKGMYYVPTRC